MPQLSEREQLLLQIDHTLLQVMNAREANRLHSLDTNESDWSDRSSEWDGGLDPIIITPLTPLTPSDSELESVTAVSESRIYHEADEEYCRLTGEIQALRDEVERTRVLNCLQVPLLRAPQLHLLEHFVVFRPHLFRKKLRVDPQVFDCILDKIRLSPIFSNKSNNLQLPVSIQLAIFLNRAGHYGNAISPEDVAQWAGVSVGSVVNCTHRVMVALLEHHDEYISIPLVEDEDAELAREFAESRSCPAWRNGIFAVDGTTIPLFEKPSFFGETFYDRKSRYSLNCQVLIPPSHSSGQHKLI